MHHNTRTILENAMVVHDLKTYGYTLLEKKDDKVGFKVVPQEFWYSTMLRICKEQRRKKNKKYRPQKAISIEEAYLTGRAYRALRSYLGVRYIDDLAYITLYEVKMVPNCGKKTVEEIVDICGEHGVVIGEKVYRDRSEYPDFLKMNIER